MNLLLITNSYPFGGVTEQAFVEPELFALLSRFDRVTIAPVTKTGPEMDVPEGVSVDSTLCRRLPGMADKLTTLLNPGTWRALWHDRRQLRSMRGIRDAFAYYAYIDYFAKRLCSMGIDTSRTLIYTFWYDYVTCAAATLPHPMIVTRAHGHDIYEEEGFISRYWRHLSLKSLLSVYVASGNGADYLKRKFPEHTEKIKVSYLGSRNPVETAFDKAFDSGVLSLLTVSRLSQEKRVPMLMRGLLAFAKSYPDIELHWTLVGSGVEAGDLYAIANDGLPSNFHIYFHGALPNGEVHRLMSQGHFDAMVLTSRSEGGVPISICEAMSYGIPVIATAVGGVPELVGESTGMLLPRVFTDREFAEAVHEFYCRRTVQTFRCRGVWEEKFSANTLRKEFADIIYYESIHHSSDI